MRDQHAQWRTAVPIVAALLAAAAASAPVAAASGSAAAPTVTGYVSETEDNFDYTYSFRPPSGVRVVVNTRDGSLNFKRRDRSLVRARMCEESANGVLGTEEDRTGADSVRAQAEEDDRRVQRLKGSVYRAGSEFWLAVEGGACLRFAGRPGVAIGVARSMALRTTAYLGRSTPTAPSDPAGLALAERLRQAKVERMTLTATGGTCDGRGISCSSVRSPNSLAIDRAQDDAARYFYFLFSLSPAPGVSLTSGFISRGGKQWTQLPFTGCWSRLSAGELGAASAAERSGPPVAGWKMRYDAPVLLPDANTALSWQGYWSRGTETIDPSGRVIRADQVERWDSGLAFSVHYELAYPEIVTQLLPEPAC